MKNIIKILVPFSVVVASCVSTSVTRLQHTSNNDKIEVYVSKTPDKAYEEVAYIAASGSVFHNEKALLKKLKSRAVHENADAIVKLNFSYIPWFIWSIPMVEGTTIKYTNN